jgi:hypothetical protein
VDERAPAIHRGWLAFASWLTGLRASRSYAFVLLLVVIGFVFAATAPDERWSIGVLLLIQSVALMIAMWTSRAGPIGVRIAIRVVAIAVAVAELVHENRALTSASGILGGLLAAATIVVIARGVVSHHELNARSVIGAITVYVLLGMPFVFIFTVVAVIGTGRSSPRARTAYSRCGCNSASPPSRRSATATTRRPATPGTRSRSRRPSSARSTS